MRQVTLTLPFILLLSSALPGCGKSRPSGFLFPCGGVTAAPEMPSRVEMARTSLELLSENRKAGAKAADGVCYVDVRDVPANVEAVRDTYFAAGLSREKFHDFFLKSREESDGKGDGAAMLETIRRDCGIIYIPGGDQFRQREFWKDTRFSDLLKQLIEDGGGITGNSAGAALQGSLGYFPHMKRSGTDLTTKRLLEGTSFFESSEGYSSYPDTDDDDNEIERWARFSSELEPGILVDGPKVPLFYVETHADSRERAPRALAILAAWEHLRRTEPRFAAYRNGPGAVGLVVDNDTAPLITFSAEHQGLVAEVHGSRSVEFLVPDEKSSGGLDLVPGRTESLEFRANPDGTGSSRIRTFPVMRPYFTNVRSELLLAGGKIILSGPRRGTVLNPGKARWTDSIAVPTRSCLKKLPARILGEVPNGRVAAATRAASSVLFTIPTPDNPHTGQPVSDLDEYYIDDDITVRDPETGDDEYLSRDLDNYLVGDLRPRESSGCGFWLPQAFSYYGQPRNRLAATRYALGLGDADFAVQLPWGMLAERRSESNLLFRFNENASEDPDPVSDWARDTAAEPSSVALYDVSYAEKLGVNTYVADEYQATKPIQTGTWVGGRVHLLLPDSTWDLRTGVADLPDR